MDAVELLPEAVKQDVLAVRSISEMINIHARGQDPKLTKDLTNRISQAMERIADWENDNPELARQIAETAAAQA